MIRLTLYRVCVCGVEGSTICALINGNILWGGIDVFTVLLCVINEKHTFLD